MKRLGQVRPPPGTLQLTTMAQQPHSIIGLASMAQNWTRSPRATRYHVIPSLRLLLPPPFCLPPRRRPGNRAQQCLHLLSLLALAPTAVVCLSTSTLTASLKSFTPAVI